MTAGTVWFVLPGGIDDPTAPSGGNVYDRHVGRGLAEAGWTVRPVPVDGAWPRPGTRDLARLADGLAAVPDGGLVLLDGLVACPAPDVVTAAARRLRPAVLVHLPLADETGLDPAEAADADTRERRTLHAAAAVIATSGWARRRLVEHHGLEPAAVRVAAPGVEPAEPATGRPDGSRLLCVASVTPRKGHDVLVQALTEVADLSWSCVCVGGLDAAPPHVARVRALVDAADLAGRVELVGPRDPARLADAYAAADLLVLASHTETYGMVVTEALARGVPVLATDTGGVPEAVGRTSGGAVPGLLVPPGDPAALAGALRRWLTAPDLRVALRAAARQRRDELPTWQQTATLIASVLADLKEAPVSTPRQPADGTALAGAGPAPAAPSDQQPVYSPSWLTLRESADADARAADLIAPLSAVLADRTTPLTIVDLGCGTGSMARWLAGRLPGPQHWVLCDRDPALLEHALAGMPGSAADGTPVSARTRCVDLTGLTAADLAGAHLVTASALLDLLTVAEVERLAAACVAAGCPALLTLSVTGQVELSPGDPLDADLVEAFNSHQRREIDGRLLLGPGAADAAVAAFTGLGAAVRVRPADWRLGARHDELTRRWLDGWLAAAGEQRPDLTGPITAYRGRRSAQLEAGDLRVVVGHRDLLALPGEPSDTAARTAVSRLTEEVVCAGPSRPLPAEASQSTATTGPTSGGRHSTLGSVSQPHAAPRPGEA